MQKITPFLWFDGTLAEAVAFYTGIFDNSHIVSLGSMTATFVIEGQTFMGLNGGPGHPHNDAVSFFVHCETQEEIDRYWTKLTGDGGAEGRCGWLKDKFGVSWQVVPAVLGKYLGDPDRAKAGRVMQAMLTMTKLDVSALDRAYAGA